MDTDKSLMNLRLPAFRPAFTFLLKLLTLLILLKFVFFFYNGSASGGWHISSGRDAVVLAGWSLFYDICIISVMAIPLAFFYLLFKSNPTLTQVVSIVFGGLFSFMILLNTVDIFYFSFKLQRTDVELLYVLRNPLHDVNFTYFLIAFLIIAAFILLGVLAWRWITVFQKANKIRHSQLASLLFFSFICLLILLGGRKKFLPTYPLVNIKYNQLPLVQNSFHQFVYSLFRGSESIIFDEDYLRSLPDSTRLNIVKSVRKSEHATSFPLHRNIILFIMESVPYDFFDSLSNNKVKMPFLDSLLQKSTFFTHSFSYSFNSNKGITAILSGTPTFTDIPLYHSAYTSIPLTHVGSVLQSEGYQSAFFIGDNYDDFGFAKCVNWLGIQRYYSMEDVPGYQDLEKHTLGLHDEFVLRFMNEKVGDMPQPFFATDFNITTHFPGNVPSTYVEKYPEVNTTDRMKAMSYYSQCLSEFFAKAKTQSWYRNTVFIFCSDHWMYPNFKDLSNDVEKNFRIALFVFDPLDNTGRIVNTPVSQLDVMNTILHVSGYDKPFLSYGEDIWDTHGDSNRVVFARANNVLYQAFDSSYVLGFDVVRGKPEFCYNYVQDPSRHNNLVQSPGDEHVNRLTEKMKQFLHTGYMQYKEKKVF